MKVTLNTDGGVRTGGVNGPTGGKTGVGAIAAVIKDEDGKVIFKEGLLLEGDATVNECEYSAIIYGLHNARKLGATEVSVRSDSQLVVYQILGSWMCKDARLREYLDEVEQEVIAFDSVSFTWVKRDFNQHADQIARAILDAEMEIR